MWVLVARRRRALAQRAGQRHPGMVDGCRLLASVTAGRPKHTGRRKRQHVSQRGRGPGGRGAQQQRRSCIPTHECSSAARSDRQVERGATGTANSVPSRRERAS